MAKDPAFLFYPGDWMGGTVLLTRHQKGCYIDLLMAQFNNGPLSLEQIKILLGTDQATWTVLQAKFKRDSNGNYYNEKLATEIERRKLFTASRSNNKSGRKKSYDISYGNHMIHHMENENENENENEKKGGRGLGKGGDKTRVSDAEKHLMKKIEPFVDQFGKQMCRAFYDYWTEKSDDGKPMRFEMEKVFDVKKRLATWKKNESKFTKGFTQEPAKYVRPVREINPEVKIDYSKIPVKETPVAGANSIAEIISSISKQPKQ